MKFVLVVLCALILVVPSQMISLEDLVRAYDITNNEIGTGTAGNEGNAVVKVASQALFIPMNLRDCTNGGCNFTCWLLGYKYGVCINPTTCRCYSSAS